METTTKNGLDRQPRVELSNNTYDVARVLSDFQDNADKLVNILLEDASDIGIGGEVGDHLHLVNTIHALHRHVIKCIVVNG